MCAFCLVVTGLQHHLVSGLGGCEVAARPVDGVGLALLLGAQGVQPVTQGAVLRVGEPREPSAHRTLQGAPIGHGLALLLA